MSCLARLSFWKGGCVSNKHRSNTLAHDNGSAPGGSEAALAPGLKLLSKASAPLGRAGAAPEPRSSAPEPRCSALATALAVVRGDAGPEPARGDAGPDARSPDAATAVRGDTGPRGEMAPVLPVLGKRGGSGGGVTPSLDFGNGGEFGIDNGDDDATGLLAATPELRSAGGDTAALPRGDSLARNPADWCILDGQCHTHTHTQRALARNGTTTTTATRVNNSGLAPLQTKLFRKRTVEWV